MSWLNPTPDEANEQYYYNRNKYNNALAQRRASEKQEAQYIDQKNAATAQMNTLSEQKVNFEKRIQGLDEIIKSMEGLGGSDVPSSINKAAKQLQKVDSSYRGSIRASGTIPVADLGNAFSVKTVDAEPHSSMALQQFRAEKSRLEQEVTNLKLRIASLSSQIASLTSQINGCNSVQSSLTSQMNTCAYEMNHYKPYMA